MEQGLTKEERTWGMLCHLSAYAMFIFPAFGNIIGPLIIWLIKKDESPYIDEQGKEALNFQISWTIYMLVAGVLILILIGIPLLIGLGIANCILVVIASIKANDGVPYKYPLTLKILN